MRQLASPIDNYCACTSSSPRLSFVKKRNIEHAPIALGFAALQKLSSCISADCEEQRRWICPCCSSQCFLCRRQFMLAARAIK